MNQRPITIIAAMSENRVIGAGAGMPWNVPEEYERYVKTVTGQTVIFGRKSYEIFGRDLKDTQMIVVTHRPDVSGARVAASLEEALKLAKGEDGNVFIAGGASIYDQAIPLADRMLLSTIHGEFAGDTYFPSFDPSEWTVERLEQHDRYTFREWVRVE